MNEEVKAQKPPNKWYLKKRMFVVYGILALFLIASLGDSKGSPSTGTQATPKVADKDTQFSNACKARFDTIKSSIAELNDIHYVDDTCSSVVYFDFKSVPSDLETIIRGNAVTFSNFRTQTYGVGHVTVYGDLNGNTILKCSAADGKVTECTNN